MKNLRGIPQFLTVLLLTLTAQAQPTITSQPASSTNAVGDTAQFTVSAIGSGTLAYQWLKIGTNLVNGIFSGRATVSGATTTTLGLASVTTNDQSAYSCRVTDTSGSVTSIIAVLTVIVPPGIITQPASYNTNAGATVKFSVVASGTAPLAYQWREGGSNITGATLSSYTISGVGTNDSGT